MTHRTAFIYALKQKIGKPYLYGGQGPEAFDCSGLVVECLNEAGMSISDTSAQGLYNMFKNCAIERIQAPPGSLFFYGDGKQNISHVMAVIEHFDNAGIVLAGARGGNHTTTTPEIATQQRAYVATEWGDYWLSKFVCAVDPFCGA